MKSKLNILLGGVLMLGAVSVFTACSDDDDFTPTIFNTDPSVDYLDKSLFTFPLDTFVKKEFLEPYNVRFVYRMEDVASDMEKNLVPAAYDKSVDLAVLTKYLWYDIYRDDVSAEFLKRYSPRILHIIGSAAYETSSGSEVLGVTEGGVKVTLYKTNFLDVSNIATLNEYFFHTMHHEFAHVLNQNIERPTVFNTLSVGSFFGSDWTNQSDSMATSRGFVTPYGGEMATEDWAETQSCYITDDSITWARKLATASYDWEEYDINARTDYSDSLGNFNRAQRYATFRSDDTSHSDTIWTYNSKRDSIYYNLRMHGVKATDVMGYLHTMDNGQYKIYRKVVSRDANGLPVPTADWQVAYLEQNGIDGRSLILQKLELVRTWLRENFNLDIDKIRYDVQHHQYQYDANDQLVIDANGRLVNKLMQPYEGDPSVTLIDHLRSWVNQYKALQTNN